MDLTFRVTYAKDDSKMVCLTAVVGEGDTLKTASCWMAFKTTDAAQAFVKDGQVNAVLEIV